MKRKMSAILICLCILFTALSPVGIFAEDNNALFFESFENASSVPPEGWEFFSKLRDVTIYTENASDGSKSIRLKDDDTTAAVGLQSPKLPAEAGKSYTGLADVYNISGVCSMYMKFYNSAGKEVGSKSVGNQSVGSWNRIAVTNNAPADTATVSLILYIINSAVGEVLFDNISIVEGTVVLEKPKGVAPVQTAPVEGKLITPNGANLDYSVYNEQGDKLSDYSYAGFYAGEIDLPQSENIPVITTLTPSEDANADDTGRIQQAIDLVAAVVSEGGMAAVKLEAGRYNISKTGISLKSGVVLSGSGQGPNGTVLYAKDPSQYTVIKATGGNPSAVGEKVNITDDYVKAGSLEINVDAADIGNFSVGDLITIYHPSTDEWAKAVEMSNMTNVNGDDSSWKADNVNMLTERTITAINGTTISMDFPLFVPHDKKTVQSTVYKTDDSKRLTNFGIENLRLESYYNGAPDDESHSNTAIAITSAKNGFVRNISAKYFVLSAVRCAAYAKQITVQNCSSLQPVSQVAGSRRYAFQSATSAQQILFTGCYSYDGRHDYMSSFSATGPLVYVDNVADSSNNASETHGTWTTGLLYDNIYQISSGSKGVIALANRGIYGGVSQGWTGAGCVAWNCLSSAIVVHKPPATYQNFMIGVWGRYLDQVGMNAKSAGLNLFMPMYKTDTASPRDARFFETNAETPFIGDGYREAETTPVEPRSIYKAQLALRKTGDYRNVKPNAPIIESPRAEASVEGDGVDITGFYQMGAERVTVYVDDKAYEATLNGEDCTFKVNVPLAGGWHKIYATQTIGGVEGTKNADRFVKIGSGEYTDNPEYLSSIYPREKTALITNDSRAVFNENESGTDIGIKVLLNGNRLESDVEPLERNGRVLVPMRAIFEGLAAVVDWDEATATATAVKDDITVKVTENDTKAYVNGEEVELDVPAYIISDRFMVPVRFIAESFGAKVDWIDSLKIVTIASATPIYQAKNDIKNALTVVNATQSGDDGAGQVIGNSLDGSLGTYWGVSGSEEGEAWGIYELGSVKKLTDVYIAFHKGEGRVYTFSIDVSEDGQNYTRVIDRQPTSGKTNELEKYSLNGVSAKYIKYIGYGNDTNAWNSMSEITFVGE